MRKLKLLFSFLILSFLSIYSLVSSQDQPRGLDDPNDFVAPIVSFTEIYFEEYYPANLGDTTSTKTSLLISKNGTITFHKLTEEIHDYEEYRCSTLLVKTRATQFEMESLSIVCSNSNFFKLPDTIAPIETQHSINKFKIAIIQDEKRKTIAGFLGHYGNYYSQLYLLFWKLQEIERRLQ